MNFFCVNEILCYSSDSNPMPAIYSCSAIRLQQVLRVSLPDEFYVTNFNVAVASDGSLMYAVGYSVFCSCFWQLYVCVN